MNAKDPVISSLTHGNEILIRPVQIEHATTYSFGKGDNTVHASSGLTLLV